MRGDFYNWPGRQKRKEFSNNQAGPQKKRKMNNIPGQQNKDILFKQSDKRLLMDLI